MTNTFRRPLFVPLAAALLASMGLSGCGGSSPDAPAASATSAPASPSSGGGSSPPPAGNPAPQPPAQSASPPPVAGGSRWSDPATWGGAVPPANAVVVIPAGKTVILDGATPPLRGLQVRGTLVAGDNDVSITSDYVFVDGGRLQIGSADRPYLYSATVTLTGASAAENPGTPGFGNKGLAVMGGTLELHGRPVARSWTKLDGGDVAAGATQIRLAEAPGWRAGDQIVIATSTFNQNEYSPSEIERIDGNVVTLRTPTRHKHFGAVRSIGDIRLDVRAEVGLLSRNIVIQGDASSASSRIGGHAMFMAGSQGATVQIAGTEFRAMGQFDHLGRYPLHFHLMGDACRNCYVRDNTIRDSIQRGIVVHDTGRLTLAGNVVFNTVGHNIVVETGVTNGNVFDRNLALVNRQPNPVFTEATLATQNDRMPANLWIRGADNVFTNNALAGSFANGAIYDNPGPGNFDFRNNVIHAAMGAEGIAAGDFDTMAGLMILAGRPEGHRDRIEDTLAYHNSHGIWPEESFTPYVIDRFIVAENGVGVQNRGVGSKQIYRNGVFVGRIPNSTVPGVQEQGAMHNQYGSDNLLENPTFVNHAGPVGLGGTDTNPTQSSYRVVGARFVNSPIAMDLGGDMSRMTFVDDSAMPRGYYVDVNAPWLAYPGCTKVAGGDAGHFRCGAEPGIAELEVRLVPGATFGQKIDALLTRSDGLRYARGTPGVASGMHSTVVLHGMSSLSYALEQRSNYYALRLWDTGGDLAVIGGTARTLVSVALAAPPTSVRRASAPVDMGNPGGDPDGTDPVDFATLTQTLRAAATVAELAANPSGGYYYDAAARRLWLHATPQWVVVQQ